MGDSIAKLIFSATISSLAKFLCFLLNRFIAIILRLICRIKKGIL